MVTRRGLFVLEDISSGLERTKEIVTGARESSSNVRTVLKYYLFFLENLFVLILYFLVLFGELLLEF